MPFRDPIVAGNTLVRDAIHSQVYVPGSLGWSINRDGTAEFNDVLIRGDLRTGPPAPYVQILDGSSTVDFIPAPIGALVDAGHIGASNNDLLIQSPRVTPGFTDALQVYIGSGNNASADPVDHALMSVQGHVSALQIAAAQNGFEYATDNVTRSTAGTGYVGIAGQLTTLTVPWPLSGKLLLLLWALTNNATAGANTMMDAECRAGALGGAVIDAATDMGCVRNNSTGNQSGFGLRLVDLRGVAVTNANVYVRCVFRVSAGTGNFVQSALAAIVVP